MAFRRGGIMGRGKSLENPIYLALSSLIFSSSWMILSFTFPIIGNSYGVGYLFTGILGALVSLPFLIVGFFYRNYNKKLINFGMKAPFLVLSILCFILVINQSFYFLVPVVVVGGSIQSFFWISTEIEINLLEIKGHAELYSAAWGIPAGILPAVIGSILHLVGYPPIFVFTGLLFLLGFILQPVDKKDRIAVKKKLPDLMMVLPMLFVGILAGFTFFVLIPLLINRGVELYLIGIIVSIWGISFAGGSLLLNFLTIKNIERIGLITSLFVSLPVVWILSFNIFTIIAVLSIGGIGVSVGFSKILSYLSDTSSPGTGVFFYESLFGIGFITGSLAGSVLYSYLAMTGIFILFAAPLLYLTLIISKNYFNARERSRSL